MVAGDMKFTTTLKHLADNLDANGRLGSAITVEVTEQYARRVLHIKRKEPLIWRHIPLTCIGSKRWREKQQRLTETLGKK